MRVRTSVFLWDPYWLSHSFFKLPWVHRAHSYCSDAPDLLCSQHGPRPWTAWNSDCPSSGASSDYTLRSQRGFERTKGSWWFYKLVGDLTGALEISVLLPAYSTIFIHLFRRVFSGKIFNSVFKNYHANNFNLWENEDQVTAHTCHFKNSLYFHCLILMSL